MWKSPAGPLDAATGRDLGWLVVSSLPRSVGGLNAEAFGGSRKLAACASHCVRYFRHDAYLPAQVQNAPLSELDLQQRRRALPTAASFLPG